MMDAAGSRVLLVGAGTYGPAAQLEDLPSVTRGIERLRQILTDSERGGLVSASCVTVLDPATPQAMMSELQRCAREAEDALVVYYSGHGVTDPEDGSLLLAVAGTDKQQPYATAVPIAWIRREVRASDARAKVVILDCCYSGRAIPSMSAGELAEQADIEGSFVMTAAAANKKALAPDGESFTAFTGSLIDVLEAGVAEAGEYLDLDTIYRRLRKALRSQGRPEPEVQRINEASRLALSRNVAFFASSPLKVRTTEDVPETAPTQVGRLLAPEDRVPVGEGPPHGLVDIPGDVGLLESASPTHRERGDRLRRLLLGKSRDALTTHTGLVESPNKGKVGICCSGDGVRAIGFSLGALQALQSRDVLQQARYLTAAGGGAYVAASFSLVAKTRPSGDFAHEEDSDPDLVTETAPPYQRGSPEERLLRERCSNPTATGLTRLSLVGRALFGLTLNLVMLGLPLLAAGIAAAAFLYGPAYGDLAGRRSCGQENCFHAQTPAWAWETLGCTVALLLSVYVVVQLRPVRSHTMYRFLTTWSTRLLWFTIALGLGLIVIPALIELARNLDARATAAPATPSVARASGQLLAGVALLLLGVLLVLGSSVLSTKPQPRALTRGQLFLRRTAIRVCDVVTYMIGALIPPAILLTVFLVGAVTTLANTDSGTSSTMYVLCAAALAVFAILYLTIDVNALSLHVVHLQRLSEAVAFKRVLSAQQTPTAVERNFDRLIPLSGASMRPGWAAGGPTLVLCATTHVSALSGFVRRRPRAASFTFSPTAIGAPLIGAQATATYERSVSWRRQQDITLLSAAALTGAALSVAPGKRTRRPARILLALANIHSGLWIPNPRHVVGSSPPTSASRRTTGFLRAPRASNLLRAVTARSSIDDRFLYVTGAAHYDALGLVELLRRGCGDVYCFAADADLGALGRAMTLAESELGVEIELQPATRDGTHGGIEAPSPPACVIGTIRYPQGLSGRIVCARPAGNEDLPLSLDAGGASGPEELFDVYRSAGARAGQHAVTAMTSASASRLQT